MVCYYSIFADILSYKINHHFSISTRNGTGLRAQGSIAGVTTEYNQEDIHASVKVDVDSKLPVQLLVPDKVEYFYKNAALSTRLPSTSRHIIQLSATFGAPHLAFGMETLYNLASKRFHSFNARIRVTKPNFGGSITLTNKGNLLRASYAHYFDHEKKVAEAAVVSRMLSEKENVLVVGGTWIMDDKTTVKARFDSRGKLVTLLHHKIKPRTCIKISS
ncbi:hypothetical protein POTOM_033114 [Populus tomentosa]|uniref:Uncharacterized protein n=1 Tax=Populus tomentosa TaxID=118781 RepID=A0A8X7Z806_POPTO|nr:hypothetical protein POTOM_033114 [Populus tomentosa]